jgi:hypothetical protein
MAVMAGFSRYIFNGVGIPEDIEPKRERHDFFLYCNNIALVLI